MSRTGAGPSIRTLSTTFLSILHRPFKIMYGSTALDDDRGDEPSSEDEAPSEEEAWEEEESEDGSPSHSFCFLDMPAEIRHLIYRQTLDTRVYGPVLRNGRLSAGETLPQPTTCWLDGQETYCYNDRAPLRCRPPAKGCFGLLVSCKTVYSEYVRYLYESSTFVFDDREALQAFVSSCPKEYRSLIPHVAVEPKIEGPKHIQTAVWQSLCRILTKEFTGITALSLSVCSMMPKSQPTRYDSVRPSIDLPSPLLASYCREGIQFRKIKSTPTPGATIDGRRIKTNPWQHFILIGNAQLDIMRDDLVSEKDENLLQRLKLPVL